MTSILTENFSARVRLLNETKINRFVLQEGIISYFELETTTGGYTLTLGITNGVTDDAGAKDFDIEFKEIVTLRHLKEALSLDSISLLDVVTAVLEDDDPTPEDVFNKGLAIGLSKGAEVVFTDREDDLEFVVVCGQYASSYRVHRSDIPAWAFARD